MTAPLDSAARPAAHIDLDAIARNWRRLDAGDAGDAGAVVKANGYGLGAAPIARRLIAEGCRAFFVATLDEGEQLRAALPAGPSIHVFNGLADGAGPRFLNAGLSPVLNSLAQVEAWAAARSADAPPADLHVDTGMNRLGLCQGELAALLDRPELIAAAGVELVMSHLACADTPSHPKNARQLARFRDVLGALRAHAPRLRASLANSAGALLGPEHRFDLVRPGIALYGGDPFAPGARPAGAPTPEPVVTLTAPIIQLRDVTPGDHVGYGAAHEVDAPARLATVALGYADGVLRAGGGRGYGVLAGARAPIVGRISMDLITVDVTAAGQAARPGARVEFLGPHAPLADAAAAAGTIPYELLTGLGPRCERVYAGEAAS
ncbi:MAG: alanine racemase [Caulobacterales bacterium]|nr:alanine racemase [Caulobacterales bacterium]